MTMKVKKGFSLIEVIIALAVFMIIIIPIFSLTLGTTKITKQSEDKLKASAIGQEVMEKLKNDKSLEGYFESGDLNNTVELLQSSFDKDKVEIRKKDKDKKSEEKTKFYVYVNIQPEEKYKILRSQTIEEMEQDNNKDNKKDDNKNSQEIKTNRYRIYNIHIVVNKDKDRIELKGYKKVTGCSFYK
ncbi:prepilin-type N-terminal cleavage/methylation domain-containing protein [Clostridium botulinum]|nr:prepilin-type N-terminal cleavage/methylation domain-containing protein [Clostridium botulinum]